MPFCVRCGKEASQAALFCPYCGASIPTLHIASSVPSDTTIDNLAGLGQRIVAFIFDSIVLGLAVTATIMAFVFARVEILPLHSLVIMNFLVWRMAHPLLWIIFTAIPFVYYVVLEKSSGQTLGKRLMGIRVVKTNGERCDLVSALVRNALRFIDNLFFGLIGILLIASTRKKQRLGDIFAQTVVVKSQTQLHYAASG